MLPRMHTLTQLWHPGSRHEAPPSTVLPPCVASPDGTVHTPSVLHYGGEQNKGKAPVRCSARPMACPPPLATLDLEPMPSCPMATPIQATPPELSPMHQLHSSPDSLGSPSVPQHFVSPPTGIAGGKDIALSFATINTGGCITVERFSLLLTSLITTSEAPPLFIALVEFRPQGSQTPFLRKSLQQGYHLVFDAPDTKGGVGFLLSSKVLSTPPAVLSLVPGRLIQVDVQLSPDPHFPPTSLCSFYGSNLAHERAAFVEPLQKLLSGNVVLMGDFNATTQPTDASTLTSNHWHQLRAWELSGQLIDTVRQLNPLPPYTRTRRYGGTKSYLDRIYLTQVAAKFLTAKSFLVPDMTGAPGFADHDPLILICQPWSIQIDSTPRCTLWSHKDLRSFNSLLQDRFSPPSNPNLGEAESCYALLSANIQECMNLVNEQRQRPRPAGNSSSWEDTVRSLLRQARRRTKLFFRRIKSAYFVPPVPSILPCPRREIQRQLQQNRPFDRSIFDSIPVNAPQPNPTPPTLTQLRHLSHAVRRKAPGPDGIPPYLLCHLPDPIFSFVHTYILLMYAEGTVPASVSMSTTLPLYKGKGSWTDPDRWRPIAMSNSIYRLLTRWIYSIIQPMLAPFLSKHQYGGLRGRSCGMATAQLLDSMFTAPECNGCLLLDLYHAFDTPPKAAVLTLLRIRGIPPGILLLLTSIFQEGTTRLLGQTGLPFGTTCGIKQGCPLSCLLFTSYFQLFLDFLTNTLRLPCVAFVDDVAALLHTSQLRSILTSAASFLRSMGLVLNQKKSELLLLKPCDTIPNPPCPIVEHVMHLGHPIPQFLNEKQACTLIMEELKRTLAVFHDVPLPSLHRVRLVNTVILPAFLHRAECLWIPPGQQKEISTLLLAFCLGVAGLPPHLSPKTIHSPPPFGLGLHHFAQRYTTRVLDTLHKAHLYSPMQPFKSSHLPMQPLTTFLRCLSQNNPTPVRLQLAEGQLPPGEKINLPNALQATHTTHAPPHLPLGVAYSDGSFFPSSLRAGAAAISPGGHVLMARTPGIPGIYPSELLGVILASHSSPPHSLIKLDNQGVVKVLATQKRVVRHSHLVTLARTSIQAKGQSVGWIKGHAGSRGNELADLFARQACTLPSQVPANAHSPWDVIVEGLAHFPPHKCWTETRVPSHRHAGIHPISFTPLKRSPDSLPWIRWIFGLCWRPGWAAYQTFWTQAPSRRACPHCLTFHNASINGTLSFCDSHPLRQAWLQAWGHHPLVLDWVRSINHEDRILLGKACVPITLYKKLVSNLGRQQARRTIFSFQRDVISLLRRCLDALSLPNPVPLTQGKRKRIWIESDWDHQGGGVPTPRRGKQRPTSQPLISSILHRLAPTNPNPPAL